MAQDLLEQCVFLDGEHIFHLGDSGGEAYLIREGEVRIIRYENDKDVELGVCGPGSLIGEMAIVSDKPRMATAISVGETYCYSISRRLFKKLIKKADLETQSMVNFLVNILRDFTSENGDTIKNEGMASITDVTKRVLIARHLVSSEESRRRIDQLEPFFASLCYHLLDRTKLLLGRIQEG